MHQSFPTVAANAKAFHKIVGSFMIFLFQGVKILVKFWKDNFYFGDWKPENMLVSFKGKRFILGDFGCSMIMEEEGNHVKGCTPLWCIPQLISGIQNGDPLSKEILKNNEVHSFCLAFKDSIDKLKEIETDYTGKDS